NKFCKFPYIKGLEQRLQRCFNKTEFQLVFYNLVDINRLLYSKLKDPLAKDLISNVVYKVECKDCNKCYIGQTRQYLKNRIRQHVLDSNKDTPKDGTTALALHSILQNHEFDFENVTIVDRENNYMSRNISEMIFIKLNDTVNF